MPGLIRSDVADGGKGATLHQASAKSETVADSATTDAYADGIEGMQPFHQPSHWGSLRKQLYTERSIVDATNGLSSLLKSLTRLTGFIFFQNTAHPLFKAY
jgi:hypothetical protein